MKHCKKNRKTPWIVAGAAVLAVAVIACVLILGGGTRTPKNQLAGNSQNTPTPPPLESLGELERIQIDEDAPSATGNSKERNNDPEKISPSPATDEKEAVAQKQENNRQADSEPGNAPSPTEQPADEALPPTEKPDETDPTPAEPTPTEPIPEPEQTPLRDAFETEIFR